MKERRAVVGFSEALEVAEEAAKAAVVEAKAVVAATRVAAAEQTVSPAGADQYKSRRRAKVAWPNRVGGRAGTPRGFNEATKKGKRTLIDVDFGKVVLLSQLKLNIEDQLDYYRPVNIEYIADSVKTEKGLIYQYRNLTSGTLTSLEDNAFGFKGKAVRKLRIRIRNQDNAPLKIGGLTARGYENELQVRFAERGLASI